MLLRYSELKIIENINSIIQYNQLLREAHQHNLETQKRHIRLEHKKAKRIKLDKFIDQCNKELASKDDGQLIIGSKE